MKKLSLGLSALMLATMLPSYASAQGQDFAPGQLLKSKSSPAVYYIDSDLRRYAFPNAKVFSSWYADFSGVVTVDDADIAQLPLGGMVPYKAAKRLVKLQTDPKVYVVDDGGVLRWLKSEAVAKQLYGDNWKQYVDDMSDAFFAGYTLGANIDTAASFDPKKFTNIKDIWRTLMEGRLRILHDRGAGDDETQNDGFGKNKTAVCHKVGANFGVTIYLPKAAVDAHVNHGDTLGKCTPETDNDTTAPVISGETISDITATGAKVVFTTDEDATAKVYFSATTPVNTATATSQSDASLGKDQSFTLTGLTANTKYYVLVTATDAAGNKVTATEQTFTTLAAADTTAPTVTASSIDAITVSGAAVHVTADEDVTAQVFYGTATPVDVTTAAHADGPALSHTHDVMLSGLTAGTAYHAKIVVTDAAGNKTTVDEKTFTTLPAADTTAPTVTASSIDMITATSAKVHLTADENVTAVVSYGTATPVDTSTAAHVDATTLDDSQDLDLTGLTAATTYHVVITVTDAAGNHTAVAEKTFTTESAS